VCALSGSEWQIFEVALVGGVERALVTLMIAVCCCDGGVCCGTRIITSRGGTYQAGTLDFGSGRESSCRKQVVMFNASLVESSQAPYAGVLDQADSTQCPKSSTQCPAKRFMS